MLGFFRIEKRCRPHRNFCSCSMNSCISHHLLNGLSSSCCATSYLGQLELLVHARFLQLLHKEALLCLVHILELQRLTIVYVGGLALRDTETHPLHPGIHLSAGAKDATMPLAMQLE